MKGAGVTNHHTCAFRIVFYHYAPLWLLADVSEDTAIDIQHVAVHCVAGMAGEEYGWTAEFGWVEPTAGRGLGTDE